MMRSVPWLVLLCPLLLSGCAGFYVFLDDTHVPSPHANRPIGNSENMRLVDGKDAAIAPLQTETGNVWPGPVPQPQTLEDLARQPMQPIAPLEPGVPTPATSAVPALVVPPIPHHLQPRPGEDLLNGPLTPPPGAAPPAGAAAPPADTGQSIVVPNGNGTSTVIAPDGTITTIPTPPK